MPVRRDRSSAYDNVQTAPRTQPSAAVPRPHACAETRLHRGEASDEAGKVVAKFIVGFGEPLTVTVAADESAEGLLELAADEEGRMVKRDEVVYMIPCVELMKTRK